MLHFHVELVRTNFKFEAPILWFFTYKWSPIHYVSVYKCWHIFTVCHSIKINVAACFLLLPINKENLCRLSRGCYIYYTYCVIYISISSSWHHIFAIHPDVYRNLGKFTEWAIIEEQSLRRRVRAFPIYRSAMSSGLQKYVSIWTSFWIFPSLLLTARVSDCAIELAKAGSRSGTKTS